MKEKTEIEKTIETINKVFKDVKPLKPLKPERYRPKNKDQRAASEARRHFSSWTLWF